MDRRLAHLFLFEISAGGTNVTSSSQLHTYQREEVSVDIFLMRLFWISGYKSKSRDIAGMGVVEENVVRLLLMLELQIVLWHPLKRLIPLSRT